MNQEKLREILEEIDLPYRYHHFEEQEAVEPPFLIWICSDTEPLYADGAVYFAPVQIDLELYTDQKEFSLEEQVEMVLQSHHIRWRKSEDYIETENMYEVLYEIEV